MNVDMEIMKTFTEKQREFPEGNTYMLLPIKTVWLNNSGGFLISAQYLTYQQ